MHPAGSAQDSLVLAPLEELSSANSRGVKAQRQHPGSLNASRASATEEVEWILIL